MTFNMVQVFIQESAENKAKNILRMYLEETSAKHRMHYTIVGFYEKLV